MSSPFATPSALFANNSNVLLNSSGISLIEWPSRLNVKPETRLDITLTIDSTIQQLDDDDDDSKSRFMTLEPYGDRWIQQLKFLESEGYFDDLK